MLLMISFLILFCSLQVFVFTVGVHLNNFSTDSEFSVSVVLSSYMQLCTHSKKLHAQQSIYMQSAGMHVRISNPETASMHYSTSARLLILLIIHLTVKAEGQEHQQEFMALDLSFLNSCTQQEEKPPSID